MLQALTALFVGVAMLLIRRWARAMVLEIVGRQRSPAWTAPAVLIGYIVVALALVVLGLLDLLGVDVLAD